MEAQIRDTSFLHALPNRLVSAPRPTKPSAYANCTTLWLDSVRVERKCAFLRRNEVGGNERYVARVLIRTEDNKTLEPRTTYPAGFYRVYGKGIPAILPFLR
jgi:hypothetical protein